MRTITYIAAFFIILFVIGMMGSCKKGDVTAIPFQEGEYTGRDILSSRNSAPRATPVDIIFKDGKFNAGTDQAAQGTYILKGDTVITFKSNFPAYLYPSANYYLRYSDDFHIEHKADSLILTKILQPGISTDQLRLKMKQPVGGY